jgi:hypothetical protein
MEATYSSETSIEFPRTTLLCIPEDTDLHEEVHFGFRDEGCSARVFKQYPSSVKEACFVRECLSNIQVV